MNMNTHNYPYTFALSITVVDGTKESCDLSLRLSTKHILDIFVVEASCFLSL